MAFRRHHRDDGTFQGPIISGAPFRGAAFGEAAFGEAAFGEVAVGDAGAADVDDEHRNNEHVVTLTRVPSRFGAQVVVAALESCGIKAGVVGPRVVVFEGDLATARAIIAESPDYEAAGDDQVADDDQPDFGQQQ